MKLALLLLLIISFSLPMQALALFKKKTIKELALNQNIIVGGKFKAKNQDNNEIYELRLAIQDHPEHKVFTIVSLYDESTVNPIEDIVWINQENSKKPENRIKAVKVESKVNQDLEEAAVEINPTLAYDRVHADQHVISKIFFFDRDSVLPVKNKAFLHKLELYMPNASGNQYKNIQIDNFLYKSKDQETKLEVIDPYKKPFWWQRDKEDEKKKEEQTDPDLIEMQKAVMQIHNPEYSYDSIPQTQQPNAMQPNQQIMNPEMNPREFMMQQQMMQMNSLYGDDDSEADELF